MACNEDGEPALAAEGRATIITAVDLVGTAVDLVSRDGIAATCLVMHRRDVVGGPSQPELSAEVQALAPKS